MLLFEFLPLSSVLVLFKDTLANRISSSPSKIYRNIYFRYQSVTARHFSRQEELFPQSGFRFYRSEIS